jgi:hypothetical protein
VVGSVSGNKYHSFRTDAAKFCRLSKLQVEVGGGGEGGVGGTVIVSLPEPLPPPPHAETLAASTSMMLLNARLFII